MQMMIGDWVGTIKTIAAVCNYTEAAPAARQDASVGESTDHHTARDERGTICLWQYDYLNERNERKQVAGMHRWHQPNRDERT